MAREIFSIKALKDKKYDCLALSEEYAYLMGEPEKRFIAIHYGESGSGKSVYTLRFADYFARNHGKVLYNSHEESVNKTIQSRINNFHIDAGNLFVAKALSFERMCHYIEKNYYKLVIIDSVKYMGFSFDQLKELRRRFAKRKLSIILVDFGTAKYSPASGKDLLHAADVKMFFKNGRVVSESRYLDRPVEKQLFIPNNSMRQPSLFDL